jgi:hypothetical protein
VIHGYAFLTFTRSAPDYHADINIIQMDQASRFYQLRVAAPEKRMMAVRQSVFWLSFSYLNLCAK